MTARRWLATLVVVVPLVSFAKPPQLLGYQGRLLDSSGNPAVGPVQLKFSLYDVATGGSPSATETQTLALTNGYYSTFIGKTAGSAFEAGLAGGSGYLQISVAPMGSSTFEDLSPRQQIGSVAYALYSTNLSGGTVNATTVAVNGTTLVDATGKVTSALSSNACTNGQVLQWNGTAWVCATVMSGGGGNATALQSVPISMTAPANGQLLGYNGTNWLPVAPPTPTTLQSTPVSMTPPTSGQVLVYNGMQWVPTTVPSQVITASQTINVPAQFADINAALASLDGKRIASPAIVTIQVANGNYNYNAAIVINHPDGDRIRILGNTATPSNVVLTFTTNTNGLQLTGGQRLLSFNGFKLVNSLATNTAGAVIVQNGSYANVGPALEMSGFVFGVFAAYDSSVVAANTQVLGCNGSNGAIAYEAYGNSTIQAQNSSASGCVYGYFAENSSDINASGAQATNMSQFGFLTEFSGSMNVVGAHASSCGNWCYYSVWGSTMFAQSTTATSCTNGAYLAQYGSVLHAQAVAISGAPTCYQADYNSFLYAYQGTACAALPPANTPGTTFNYIVQ